MHRVRSRTVSVSLATVLVATLLTLGLSATTKAPCAAGNWSDGRQYRWLCYSDIVPLYGTEHLQGGRLPYLQPCPAQGGQCDEYPVLTMFFMRVAGWLSNGFPSFFWVNALLLSLCALATSVLLYRMAGSRAFFFALAPTLLVYAFVNWDLLTVALTAGATYAYLRHRDDLSGILLGLGAAAKFYPALVALPFALGRLQEGKRGGTVKLLAWTVGSYAAVNVPFAIAAPGPWSTFFRFNATRGVDWDSLWFVACSRLHHGAASCGWSTALINRLSLALFVGSAIAVWLIRRRLRPDFSRWTLAFPILVLFLLTNKVYSPQYGLWLLPWFALALPTQWLFVAFEVSDVAVFVTRFTWFGRMAGDSGSPEFAGFHGATLGAFQIALVVRAAILVACLVAWILRREPVPERARAEVPRELGDVQAA